jgi:hypothetical protein
MDLSNVINVGKLVVQKDYWYLELSLLWKRGNDIWAGVYFTIMV